MKPSRALARLLALLALAALLGSARNDGGTDPGGPAPGGPDPGRPAPPAATRPEPTAADFRVRSFAATWAKGGPRCDESGAAAFRFESPQIRVEAEVACGQGFDGWEVGLIQALVANRSEMAYADGRTAWEQPVLPVSDSDGPNSPFYGASAHDAAAGDVFLSYGDAPSTTMTWAMPLPPDGRKKERADSLRSIEREQDFVVWLVAFDRGGRKLIFLKELLWKLDATIELDCGRKRGSRVTRVVFDKAPPAVREPALAPAGGPGGYPDWLDGPVANEAQVFALYLRGAGGEEERYALP